MHFISSRVLFYLMTIKSAHRAFIERVRNNMKISDNKSFYIISEIKMKIKCF